MVRRLIVLLLFLGIASSAVADHLPLDAKLVMTGPSFLLPGSQLTYNLKLTGLFPHATYAVVDTLPANARLVSAGDPPWNCLEGNGKVTCGTSQLSDIAAVLTIVVDTPATAQTLVNSATITSLSTFDPVPDNNTDSLQTVLFDAAACTPRQIGALAPADGAAFTSGHVTLQWSAVPGATHYDVWVAEGSSINTLLATTTDTQVSHDFPDGEVSWYVEAAMNDCPPVDTSPQRFRIGKPAPKRRAAPHS